MENANYSYAKLRGRVVEKYGTQAEFARVYGISKQSWSKKLKCKTSFSQEDIIKCSELLDIDSSEYGSYFFA